MEKVTVLAPEYFKDFECIGSACEDTCCREWDISIDKETYEKYRKIDERAKKSKSDKFSPLSEKHITRHILDNGKKDTSDNYYGKINLVNDFCPFLDENMLCGIYKKLGSNNMSHTCKIYPRNFNQLYDTYEISLSLSCPEAARKALLNKDLMAFEYIEIDMDRTDFLETEFDTTRPEHEYFWDIRTNAITILQTRKFDLVTRLLLLGMMYQRLQKRIDEESYTKIPDTISSFMSFIDTADGDQFSNLKGSSRVQASIYKELFKAANYRKKFHKDYLVPAIQLIYENSESVYDNLKEVFSKYTKGEYSYILENYLVNEYFRTLMPFGKFETLKDGLIKLCCDYTFIQGIALGIINKNSDLSIDELINLLYMFGRNLTHNPKYNDAVISDMSFLGLDTTAGLYTLIF